MSLFIRSAATVRGWRWAASEGDLYGAIPSAAVITVDQAIVGEPEASHFAWLRG